MHGFVNYLLDLLVGNELHRFFRFNKHSFMGFPFGGVGLYRINLFNQASETGLVSNRHSITNHVLVTDKVACSNLHRCLFIHLTNNGLF